MEVNEVAQGAWEDVPLESCLTPREIVGELDKYVIGQEDAKRAVSIALRNRWRRLRAPKEIRDEIAPKNIIMIGPTGVGKTEISRRLAKLAGAPFVKVEASKFTEVGYIGRDVESIVRDLVEVAHSIERKVGREQVRSKAEARAEELLLDVLLPPSSAAHTAGEASNGGTANPTREKLRQLLREGKLDERIVEIEVNKQYSTQLEIVGPPGFAEVEGQLKDMFTNMIPKQKETRKLPVTEARDVLISDVQESLIDQEQVSKNALRRAEQSGIVFIDEIDKICGSSAGSKGPDVSREGVQRDLLPLVEGSTVQTKYGPIKTDHILFIASGAFHLAKPTDLVPELQGRLPIRVELNALSVDDFVRILIEPNASLSEQYIALMATEGVTLEFTQDGIKRIAETAFDVNERTENIGARRLHTIMERLLETLSFEAPDKTGEKIIIDEEYVKNNVSELSKDEDLSRYIL